MANPYKATEGLARWLLILFGIVALIHLVTIPIEFDRLSTLDQFEQGRASVSTLTASEDRESIVIGLYFLVWIALAITFIVWFHRLYRNLSPLGVGFLRFGTGWAIGAWFVPILNLFRPKQIANDIWRGSDPELEQHPGDGWQQRPVSSLVHWWWALWLITSAVGGLMGLPDGSTIEDQRFFATASVVYAVVDLPAIVVAAMVVRALSKRQTGRFERLGELSLQPQMQVGAPVATTSVAPPPPPAPDDFRPRPGPE